MASTVWLQDVLKRQIILHTDTQKQYIQPIYYGGLFFPGSRNEMRSRSKKRHRENDCDDDITRLFFSKTEIGSDHN